MGTIFSLCEHRKYNKNNFKIAQHNNIDNIINHNEIRSLKQLEEMFTKKIPVNKFLFKNMLDKKKKERQLLKKHETIFS